LALAETVQSEGGTAETQPGDWAAILDRLEADIFLAFAGESSVWQAPTDPGPIPPELGNRAQRLLEAQRESEQILLRDRQTAARHLEALDSIPDSRKPGRPQILDVQG
jgi:hypothetical protein